MRKHQSRVYVWLWSSIYLFDCAFDFLVLAFSLSLTTVSVSLVRSLTSLPLALLHTSIQPLWRHLPHKFSSCTVLFLIRKPNWIVAVSKNRLRSSNSIESIVSSLTPSSSLPCLKTCPLHIGPLTAKFKLTCFRHFDLLQQPSSLHCLPTTYVI